MGLAAKKALVSLVLDEETTTEATDSNFKDVILLVNISISNIEPNDSQIISGDINSDEQIDILDIILCVNLILNS